MPGDDGARLDNLSGRGLVVQIDNHLSLPDAEATGECSESGAQLFVERFDIHGGAGYGYFNHLRDLPDKELWVNIAIGRARPSEKRGCTGVDLPLQFEGVD